MNTGAEKRLSRGAHVGSLEIDSQASFPPLTELALAIPWKVAHTVRGLLHPGSTRPGRDGIDVPPVSYDWLQQAQASCRKHGDAL
jgi:hypothetical protein